MAYNTDAARWRALATRDVNANGHFIYSVRSTNIYCRPTCPARLARRANVGFYETPLQAEADGFRACKRCKPNTAIEDPQERAVEKACVLIDEAVKKDDAKALRLHDLAKNVGLTPRYFHKIFKDKMGVTPKEWAKTRTLRSSCSSETLALSTSPTSSPVEGAENEIADWNSFNFNELVDFDIDGSATLGYNLMTGAAEPVSMGHGNAIDMNILHELWVSGYELGGVGAGAFLESEDFMSTFGDPLAPARMRPTMDKQMPVTSTFEFDVDALLCCDSVLF
jgi:methylphosphotriester-DNA--protein-cysteine methyltransferase